MDYTSTFLSFSTIGDNYHCGGSDDYSLGSIIKVIPNYYKNKFNFVSYNPDYSTFPENFSYPSVNSTIFYI